MESLRENTGGEGGDEKHTEHSAASVEGDLWWE